MELVYVCEYDHLGVRYLELKRFDDAAMINGGSTKSIYKECSV